MYSKKSDKPIVALKLSQREAYAKGFGFKEIPSGLMLPLLFCGKKTISKERGKSSLKARNWKANKQRPNQKYQTICTRISQNSKAWQPRLVK